MTDMIDHDTDYVNVPLTKHVSDTGKLDAYNISWAKHMQAKCI